MKRVVAIVFAVLVVAGCSSGGDDTAPTTVTVTSSTVSTTATAQPLTLEQTANQAVAAMNAVRAQGSGAQWAAYKAWGTTACVAMIESLGGNQGDKVQGETVVTNVTETGNTGTVTTTTDSKPETNQWVRVGNEWRFTC